MNRWNQRYWARRALFFVRVHKTAKANGLPANVVEAIAALARDTAHVGNLLKSSDTPDVPCDDDGEEGCGGCGIILHLTGEPTEFRPDGDPASVECCDRCKQFADDDEAMREIELLLGW